MTVKRLPSGLHTGTNLYPHTQEHTHALSYTQTNRKTAPGIERSYANNTDREKQCPARDRGRDPVLPDSEGFDFVDFTLNFMASRNMRNYIYVADVPSPAGLVTDPGNCKDDAQVS